MIDVIERDIFELARILTRLYEDKCDTRGVKADLVEGDSVFQWPIDRVIRVHAFKWSQENKSKYIPVMTTSFRKSFISECTIDDKPYTDVLWEMLTMAWNSGVINYTQFLRVLPNKAKCKQCGTIVHSKHRHDFVSCGCGSFALDGGNDYLKVTGNFGDAQFLDWDDSPLGEPNGE